MRSAFAVLSDAPSTPLRSPSRAASRRSSGAANSAAPFPRRSVSRIRETCVRRLCPVSVSLLSPDDEYPQSGGGDAADF